MLYFIFRVIKEVLKQAFYFGFLKGKYFGIFIYFLNGLKDWQFWVGFREDKVYQFIWVIL